MYAKLATAKEIAQNAKALHDAYLPLRNTQVPFPAESVAFWCYLLGMQQAEGTTGDLLELGVEHGGTAFLSILACAKGETQTLIDLKISPRFQERWEDLTAEQKSRVSFLEMGTQDPRTAALVEQSWRYIHIDAGHTYAAVASDMKRYAGLLQPKGILCCDDFFTGRWPDVTVAILDTYQDLGIKPVALVNRKAYFARTEDADAMRARLRDTKDALNAFGTFKHWEVHINKEPLEYLEIAVSHAVTRAPLA